MHHFNKTLYLSINSIPMKLQTLKVQDLMKRKLLIDDYLHIYLEQFTRSIKRNLENSVIIIECAKNQNTSQSKLVIEYNIEKF